MTSSQDQGGAHGSPPATANGGPAAKDGPSKNAGQQNYREDTDYRDLWQPKSKYPAEFRVAQRRETIYISCLLAASLIALACIGLGFIDRLLAACAVPCELIQSSRRYEWVAAGGLLGGTVYAAKWLYHAIAKGLWHEDRGTWRLLSPWIALGATVGIGALIEAGFFRNSIDKSLSQSGASLTGLGFLIGYLSDRFLAKMRELMQVLFGESEGHYAKRSTETSKEEPKDP